jgi:hypothetical protein
LGVVDREPSNDTRRGATPADGAADITALTAPETRQHVMNAS